MSGYAGLFKGHVCVCGGGVVVVGVRSLQILKQGNFLAQITALLASLFPEGIFYWEIGAPGNMYQSTSLQLQTIPQDLF